MRYLFSFFKALLPTMFLLPLVFDKYKHTHEVIFIACVVYVLAALVSYTLLDGQRKGTNNGSQRVIAGAAVTMDYKEYFIITLFVGLAIYAISPFVMLPMFLKDILSKPKSINRPTRKAVLVNSIQSYQPLKVLNGGKK